MKTGLALSYLEAQRKTAHCSKCAVEIADLSGGLVLSVYPIICVSRKLYLSLLLIKYNNRVRKAYEDVSNVVLSAARVFVANSEHLSERRIGASKVSRIAKILQQAIMFQRRYEVFFLTFCQKVGSGLSFESLTASTPLRSSELSLKQFFRFSGNSLNQ